MIVAVIVACEIGFWLILGAGLFARYVLRRKRLGSVLLLFVPVTDLILIVASILDLRGGAAVDATHGLAAVYLGFSVAFGPDLIRWADGWFAHRFAGGPRPAKPPKYGAARVRYEWRAWLRCVLAWAITCAVTGVLALVARNAPNSQALWGYTVQVTVVTLIWFVGWPLWMTISPPKAPAETPPTGERR
ncbi:hypothetical protein [Micromonospora sp. DT233]|uniref:hypothetical protein n=1 Tax=Micromonospora sp. DT233 TaxID=3393432 RepID=UPI003CEF7D06